MSEKIFISQLTQRIRHFIASPDSTLIDEQLLKEAQSVEMQELCLALKDLTTQQQTSCQAITQIAAGNLDLPIPAGNKSLEPVKILQAKLKHLLWQTQRIAAGDYNQRVDYLGVFSDSFSILTQSLQERTQIKEALMESYRQYNLIANNITDVIWTLDIKTRQFTYISPSIIRLRGLTVEEAMNETMEQALTPESLRRVMAKLPETLGKLKQNPNYKWPAGEYQQPCKDGRIIDVEISTSFIYDSDGEPKEVLGVSRDITSRKRFQSALLRSEAKFKLIAENTRDVIWKIDLATFRYSYISPSVYTIRGYTVEEALTQSVEESLTPESAVRAIATLTDYLNRTDYENLFVCDQYQQPCKDGSIIDIELSASFILNDQGHPVKILGVTRDITERKKVELALKKSEARLVKMLSRQTKKNQMLARQLEYFFDNTINAIAFFDLEGSNIHLSKCNKRWASGLNFTPEEIEGLNIQSFLDEETFDLYRQFIFKALQSDDPSHSYVVWKNIHLDVIIIPIPEDDEVSVRQFAVLAQDVSEIVQAEQKIELSEQKFFNIFHNSSDAIIVLNTDLKLLEANKRFYEVTGYSDRPKPVQLENYEVYISEKYHEDIRRRLNNIKSSKEPYTFECELILADETLLPVEFNSSIYIENGQTLILIVMRDITSRRNFEKQFAQFGVQVETRERRKLAADLHDNVGPLLSSMNMYLSSLSRKQNVEHLEMIADIKSILKETIVSVREISNNISPHILSIYGLTAALQAFFATKRNLLNININNAIGDYRFEELKEVMCYNIIKEAFNNTLKYANATQAGLEILKDDKNIQIHYCDNGAGFDLEDKLAAPSSNLGLYSIMNRVKQLDGLVKMNAKKGEGFSIDIVFPI